MRDNIFDYHLQRIKSSTLQAHTIKTLPEWLCKHTKHNGSPFSFTDHEYQERFLREESQEVVIRKPSQVGMSEASARLAVALCNIIPGYTVIYTLPTAKFAGTFMRTRLDPIIDGSEYLSAAVHNSTDNAEVKRFGDSYLYLKGSQSNNAPISIPADHLIHDEVDFSSQEVISQYQSRLTHSKYKRKTKLSTPTIPGYGIDYEFQRSRRHFNLVKCNHCNEWFSPDYYAHVRVAGFTGDLHEITKHSLYHIAYQEAYVACPACGKAPSLQPEHREWVCENPSEHFVAAGYQISPFDAPNIIAPGYLIEQSVQYKRLPDFINYGLGLPSEDKDSTLTETELRGAIIQGQPSGAWGIVMGLDMGLLCHCVIMAVAPDSLVYIVHTEIIMVGEVVKRRKELAREWRVRMTVVDAQPYTETVMRMQEEDMNLYAAYYTSVKSIETHVVRKKDEDEGAGVNSLRQVNVNRNRAFDGFMDMLRGGGLHKVSDKNDDVWVSQLQDMKRVKQYTAEEELAYVWQKSTAGDDHFHHASLYAWTASRMLGMTRSMIVIPTLITSFRVKEND